MVFEQAARKAGFGQALRLFKPGAQDGFRAFRTDLERPEAVTAHNLRAVMNLKVHFCDHPIMPIPPTLACPEQFRVCIGTHNFYSSGDHRDRLQAITSHSEQALTHS